MNSEVELELAKLLHELVSAKKTINRLEQLGYKQKTVRENLSMLIDGVLEKAADLFIAQAQEEEDLK